MGKPEVVENLIQVGVDISGNIMFHACFDVLYYARTYIIFILYCVYCVDMVKDGANRVAKQDIVYYTPTNMKPSKCTDP